MALHHHIHQTLEDFSNLSPAQDAEALHKAMKGLGTDDDTLIKVITGRPRNYLIHKVKPVYHQNYHKNLEDDIKGDTSGHYEDILVGWITDPIAYMAQLVRKAVKGVGTNEHILTEVLCTQPAHIIRQIEHSYAFQFQGSLTDAVLGDLSGSVKALYAAILKADRPEHGADEGQAKADAQELYKHGEGKIGTDEEVFVKLISQRSKEHMELVSRVYADTHGNSLLNAIHSETSGHFRSSLEALITPAPEYFAKLIRKAIAGAGTNDDELIRVFCMLPQDLLKAANAIYTKAHGHTFKKDVQSEVSGNYGKVIVALVPDLA